MKRLILVIAALCFAAGPVFAASAAQKRNAMHHLAAAIAAEKLCPTLKTDSSKAAVVMMLFGIDLSGPDGKLMKADAEQQIDSMKDMDRDAVCASGRVLYGPNGLNVPGLVNVVE